MTNPLKYNIGGKRVDRIEAMKHYVREAENFTEPTKSAFLNMLSEQFKNDQQMEKDANKFQTVGGPIIGVFLILIILYITIFTPYPSNYQAGVFWVVLALAAAFGTALIAGSIEYTNKIGIKAVGGTAMFCIMYFFVPTIYTKSTDNLRHKLTMYVVASDSSRLQRIDIDFNINEPSKLTDIVQNGLVSYTGRSSNIGSFTCYRKSDGRIFEKERCQDLADYEVLVIPDRITSRYPGKREAFLHYKPLADSLALQ